MAINKVEYGNETLIDLTQDTVSENSVLQGVTFHSADGEQRQGSIVAANVVDNLESESADDALSANQGRVLNNKIEDNKIGYEVNEATLTIKGGFSGGGSVSNYDVLFDNGSFRPFTDGNITLSKELSNYNYIKVYYGWSEIDGLRGQDMDVALFKAHTDYGLFLSGYNNDYARLKYVNETTLNVFQSQSGIGVHKIVGYK